MVVSVGSLLIRAMAFSKMVVVRAVEFKTCRPQTLLVQRREIMDDRILVQRREIMDDRIAKKDIEGLFPIYEDNEDIDSGIDFDDDDYYMVPTKGAFVKQGERIKELERDKAELLHVIALAGEIKASPSSFGEGIYRISDVDTGATGYFVLRRQ